MSDSHCTPRTIVSPLAAFVAAGLFAFTAAGVSAQTQPEAVVPNRITQAINPDQRVTLAHNVHPLAQAKFDQGLAPASMPTGRIMLVLKPSDAQQQALKQYLGDLQDPNSPNYRKWLTPAQFGQRYGISDADLTTVTAWLQSQGFTVEKVPQARNFIIFSGNMAQIQQAFNTSIHRYLVNGEAHLANASDPQIPAALAPVVAGIAQLNDFRPERGAKITTPAHFDTEAKRIKPDLTLNNNGTDYLYTDPADAATIYDTPNSALNPKYSGTTYDGSGVTIGIAGDSNITAQDVQLYRAAFLPSSYSSNQPNIIIDGNDPGINGDAIEALLDLEVSGGIAPAAKVNFYIAASTDLQEGLILAIDRALNDNAVSILNVSFGACELNQGASGNAQILAMWQQAAAQGISVTVSTGDSGSAGCDNPNTETAAKGGLAINGLGSTAYNIAVGGTDYDALLNKFSTYVAASNSAQNVASTYYRTALSYIPESPWNDSTSTNAGGYSSNKPLTDSNGNTNIAGAGGGVSSTAVCSVALDTNGNCPGTLGPYPQPPFQKGVSNNVSSSARAVPDVSFLAADGLYGALWVVCSDNVANGSTTPQTDCQTSSGSFTNSTTFTGVGGTSAASPAFAGMLALVSQSQGGARLGQAANVLYNLASQAALYPTTFHDVATGNNSVVCQSGSPSCGSNGFLTGYNATAGATAAAAYDGTSGLGSVDVAQLIANWTKASFTATTTTLAATTSTSVTHGTSIKFNVAVTPAPAQSAEFVSIINNSSLPNNGALPSGAVQLSSSGTATVTTADLPGGSYNVYAYYGGDVNHSASQSTAVPVNISPESSQVAIGATMIDPQSGSVVCDDVTGSAPSCTSGTLQYGLATSVSAQVQGKSSSNTVATGSISFADSGGALPNSTVAIASSGIASYNNYVNQNQTLPVATNGLTASYGGDASYSASNSGSAYNIVVVKGPSSPSVSGSQSGTTVTIQAIIGTDSIGLPPSGAVNFTVGSTSGTSLGSAASPSQTGFVSGTVASLYEISIPASTAGLVNGNNTIFASYAGDANYSSSSGSATIVITGGGGGGKFSLSGSAININAGATTGNTSAISVTPASGFTGTVSLTCALTSSPGGAMNLPTCTMSPTSVSITGTAAGTATLTVASTAHTSGALAWPLKNLFEGAGGTALACILMFTIPARRKGWRAILSLIAFAIAISGVIGCGGGSSGGGGGGSTGGTTSGAYVFTVTGSSSSSGSSTSASTTVQVNIN